MMQRYQIYLEPEKVRILDKIAAEQKVSRAEVVREAIEEKIEKAPKKFKKKQKEKNPLLDLIGFGVSKTGKISENIDEIYRED